MLLVLVLLVLITGTLFTMARLINENVPGRVVGR